MTSQEAAMSLLDKAEPALDIVYIQAKKTIIAHGFGYRPLYLPELFL